jgi:hypothetical protein
MRNNRKMQSRAPNEFQRMLTEKAEIAIANEHSNTVGGRLFHFLFDI